MNRTDKPAFLLLSGVLTSLGACALMAGCTIQAEAEDDPETATGAVEAPPSANTTSETTTSGGTSGTGGGKASGSSSGGTATKDGGAAPAKDSGSTPPKDGGGATGACLDDTAPAAPTACPTVGAGDQCVGACADFATSWKKGLADDVRKCMTAAICQAGNTDPCAEKALAKACPDPTAATFCTTQVKGCKDSNAADTITQASCEGIAKGLTATGRKHLETCFATQANCGDCPARFK